MTAVDGEALRNRLRKNLRALSRWARREGVRCYRVYDADMFPNVRPVAATRARRVAATM